MPKGIYPRPPRRACAVEDCGEVASARGWCRPHYARWRKYGTPTPAGLPVVVPKPPDTLSRFLGFVDKTEDCWVWTGARSAFGYGQISINGRPRYAHRVSFELFSGPIPADEEVCHACDNPPCVRPEHLFLGSHRENMQDASRKGRMAGNGGQLGSANGFSKLNEEAVAAIRLSEEPTRALAERYGVSIWAIQNARTGRRWKHVPVAPRGA